MKEAFKEALKNILKCVNKSNHPYKFQFRFP